jgi:hypothetical protein
LNGKETLTLIAIFDIIVGFAFIASNWYIWDYINGKLAVNVWGPFQVVTVLKEIAGGQAVTIGTFIPIPNYSFLLFWVALAGNFVLVALAFRADRKKTPAA